MKNKSLGRVLSLAIVAALSWVVGTGCVPKASGPGELLERVVLDEGRIYQLAE